MPSTTGSTASRWLGLLASVSRTERSPGALWLPSAPRWYFTSPEPCGASGSSSPSNSRKICPYDLPIVFASTLRRPRCAIPNTASSTPDSAARSRSASSIAMTLSAPSRPKRLWPTNFVWRNVSNASAAFSRSRMRCLRSRPNGGCSRSTRSWIHSFSAGSWMCMYSRPIVREYASRRTRSTSRRRIVRRPPIPAHGNSRSRSQIVRPWCTGSSSGWVFGSFSPSGSRFAMRCPRTR